MSAGGGGFDVDGVAGLDDPVLRNLCITQTYSDFGQRFGALLGEEATWCSFGVWASNTAGLSIRKAEIWPSVARLLDEDGGHHAARESLNHELAGFIERGVLVPLDHNRLAAAFEQALDRVSVEIAGGNVAVFAELAPLFSRFLDIFERARPRAADGGAFLASIGADRLDASAPEPGLLAGAFGGYFEAAFMDDGDERALVVLAANVRAVLHEQQRLQGAVRAALDAGTGVLGDLLHLASPAGHSTGLEVVVRHAPGALRWLGEEIDRLWQQVATLLLMRLFTKDESLHLGADVPAVLPGPLFPPALRVLHGDAVALFDRLDRTRGTGAGSAAKDWADLGQRMNYIVNLFRSRQQHPPIRSEPFSPEQVAALRGYRMPAGPFISA